MLLRRYIAAGLMIMASSVCAMDAEETVELPENERWSSFLPLYGDHVEAMGHDLPLPFGVGLNVITLKRDIDVKEVKAGFNGNLQSVDDYIAADATTYVNTILARADVWILPFLNVYGMGGYLENSSDVDVTFSIPTFPPGSGTTNLNVKSSGDLTGTVWGGGLTLAAGYGDFFLMLDGNYVYSELDSLLDETIQVAIFSARTGWNGKFNNIPTRLWVGGMYWDADRVVKGSIPVGNNTLDFEVLQGPAKPTNLVLGGQVDFSKRWNAMAEYSFNFEDLRMLAVGLGYRF